MAWTCSAASNEGLVTALMRAGIVETTAVQQAMLRIDRAWFVPAPLRAQAYNDNPLPIGHNVTISAPHMHAIMLELLHPYVKRGVESTSSTLNILDNGSGSGYLTAALCDLSGERGSVIGVEHVKQLLEGSMEVSRRHFPDWLKSGRLSFLLGDGRNVAEVLPDKEMRFDVIHVGAAAERNIPTLLTPLLKSGGCVVIPVQKAEIGGPRFS